LLGEIVEALEGGSVTTIGAGSADLRDGYFNLLGMLPFIRLRPAKMVGAGILLTVTLVLDRLSSLGMD